jgi:BirA family biotin operon repressor/biotin-[acetyl-CoA-carboxylase] ligase
MEGYRLGLEMSYPEPAFQALQPDTGQVAILDALLAGEERFVSGSVLAVQLGVSRPAIHGKLEKLRESGFEIEAVRNRGYRITGLPETLHPALMRRELNEAGSTMDAFYFKAIDSTNNEAERRVASGQASPFAVVSSCQTKGRGRLGREWHSASADNLYLSVLFQPNIPPQQLQHFTLWAGIHICRALQKLVPEATLKIKWPNDLHCKGRKFAGMLTEAKMDADSIRSIVFGVGLNVNSNPNNFPDSIRKTATSLHAIGGDALPINTVAAQVIRAVERAYAVCIENSDAEDLPAAWSPLNALEGQAVTAIRNGQEISGIAGGIDTSGALLLRLPNGTEQAIRAGDVTLKKRGG